jgi:hypothetical protein
MPADMWIGVGGVVLVAAAAYVRAKVRRKGAAVAAGLLVAVGWTLVAQFLFKPLVPAPVVAGILLGGLTLMILLTAVIGSRSGRAKRAPKR